MWFLLCPFISMSGSSLATGKDQVLAKLSSTERVRFTLHGEVPVYKHMLLNVTSEQHPMQKAVEDLEASLAKNPRMPT